MTRVQCQLQVHSKFKVSLGSARPCLKLKAKSNGFLLSHLPLTIPFWSKTIHPHTFKILLAYISLYNLSEIRDYIPTSSHMNLHHSTETRNCMPTHLLTSTTTTYHQSMLMKPEKLAGSLIPPNPHILQTLSMKRKTCPLAPTETVQYQQIPLRFETVLQPTDQGSLAETNYSYQP